MNTVQRRVALVYKGTGSVAGWVRNFEFEPSPVWFAPSGMGVEAHGGFLRSFTSSLPAAVRLVSSALASCGGDCRLLVTGHSLGGA